MNPQPAVIIWQDSATDHGWKPHDDGDNYHLVRTMGWLVFTSKGKRGIYRIASSEDGNEGNSRIDIPKPCVVKKYIGAKEVSEYLSLHDKD